MRDPASLKIMGNIEYHQWKNAKLVNVLHDNKTVTFVIIFSPRQKSFHLYRTETY